MYISLNSGRLEAAVVFRRHQEVGDNAFEFDFKLCIDKALNTMLVEDVMNEVETFNSLL